MSISTFIEKTNQGFRVSGDLVFNHVSNLIDAGQEQIKHVRLDEISIDLDSVKRLDSAGIALLLGWKRDCLAVNKSCRFENLSQQAVSLIDTYKLQKVLLCPDCT